jgi:HEAT repeat protein
MRGKFQTTSMLIRRHARIRERIVRAVVVACVLVGVAESSYSSEMRRGKPARPLSQDGEVTTRLECPVDARPTADNKVEIEALLSELNPSSRQAAEAVPILLAALRDSETDAKLRERLAAMLARIGEQARAAVPVLIEILEQSGETSSSASAKAGAKEVSTDAKTSYWVMKSLGRFGNVAADAVPSVARFLTSPETSPQLQVLAADTLGRIRTAGAIGVLTVELMKPRRFNDYESIVLRQTIIDGLALAGPLAVGAIPSLGRASEDDNADIRRKACDALGSLGPRAEGGMNSLLERLILDQDAAVQDAAASALAQVGHPAVESLISLLERGGPELQWRAAKALGQVGAVAKRAVESLKVALGSPSTQVRIEAIDAVWKISRDPRAVTAVLVKTLSEDDRQVRRRAAGMLVELEPLPRETAVALQELATSGNTNERRAAEYVIRERTRRAK